MPEAESCAACLLSVFLVTNTWRRFSRLLVHNEEPSWSLETPLAQREPPLKRTGL